MTPAEIAVLSSVSTAGAFTVVVWFARNLILERLRNAVRHEYDVRLETLKSDLQRDTNSAVTRLQAALERDAGEALRRLQSDLDVVKEKHVSGHYERLNAYRLVVDVFAETYSDLQLAISEQRFAQARDKYNGCWVRCYGYLSMFAPQDVMDAFDALNDYVLGFFGGSHPAQPWTETRGLALRFINSMRQDIGLARDAIEYHGDL